MKKIAKDLRCRTLFLRRNFSCRHTENAIGRRALVNERHKEVSLKVWIIKGKSRSLNTMNCVVYALSGEPFFLWIIANKIPRVSVRKLRNCACLQNIPAKGFRRRKKLFVKSKCWSRGLWRLIECELLSELKCSRSCPVQITVRPTPQKYARLCCEKQNLKNKPFDTLLRTEWINIVNLFYRCLSLSFNILIGTKRIWKAWTKTGKKNRTWEDWHESKIGKIETIGTWMSC